MGELNDVDGRLLLSGSSPWRCNGVLAYRRHCTSTVAHRTGIYPSVVLDTEAGRITGVSAHLPNRNYPTMGFVNACLSLHEVCSHVMDTSKLCIGGDANVQLAPRCNAAVGVHTIGPPSCERALIFAELAGALKLQAVSTVAVCNPHDICTHKPWNGSASSQTDYFSISKSLHTHASYTMELPCASDHRAVFSPIELPNQLHQQSSYAQRLPKFWYLPKKASKFDPELYSSDTPNPKIFLTI